MLPCAKKPLPEVCGSGNGREGFIPVMENQMEKEMDNGPETRDS